MGAGLEDQPVSAISGVIIFPLSTHFEFSKIVGHKMMDSNDTNVNLSQSLQNTSDNLNSKITEKYNCFFLV